MQSRPSTTVLPRHEARGGAIRREEGWRGGHTFCVPKIGSQSLCFQCHGGVQRCRGRFASSATANPKAPRRCGQKLLVNTLTQSFAQHMACMSLMVSKRMVLLVFRGMGRGRRGRLVSRPPLTLMSTRLRTVHTSGPQPRQQEMRRRASQPEAGEGQEHLRSESEDFNVRKVDPTGLYTTDCLYSVSQGAEKSQSSLTARNQ
jgi:hypothetical protein